MPTAHFEAFAFKEPAFLHPRLRAVQNYVRKYISDASRLTLEEVAGVVQLSPKHFSEFFSQHVGVSFSVWRGWMQIEWAKELIVNAPWKPVGVIGIAAGYHDPTTFGRAFKRFEGITPRQYREIAGRLAGLRATTSTPTRRRLIRGIAHVAYRNPTIVPLLIDLASMMRRLDDGTRSCNPEHYWGLQE